MRYKNLDEDLSKLKRSLVSLFQQLQLIINESTEALELKSCVEFQVYRISPINRKPLNLYGDLNSGDKLIDDKDQI